MKNNTLLLSIRPEYATKIFNGQKGVELRKVRPNLQPGDVVLVYVSSPIKELQGTFVVDKIIEATPEELWQKVRHIAGISRQEFDSYYATSPKGYGIVLKTPLTLSNPISLTELKKLWQNFHPPQSYRYLTNFELAQISPF